MAKLFRLKLRADSHQLHLLDEGCIADLSDAWTVKATEDRLAVGPGIVGIGTDTRERAEDGRG